MKIFQAQIRHQALVCAGTTLRATPKYRFVYTRPLTSSVNLKDDVHVANEPKAEEQNAVERASAKAKQRTSRASLQRDPIMVDDIARRNASLTRRTPSNLSLSEEDNLFTAMIGRALENIEFTRRRMANDQIEIDRLRVETQALIAELLT